MWWLYKIITKIREVTSDEIKTQSRRTKSCPVVIHNLLKFCLDWMIHNIPPGFVIYVLC